MRFAFFPLHLSKVLRLPRKSDARSYEVLHLSRKIIFAKLKIWCSKMQPLSRNQRPDLVTSLINMSLVLRICHRFWKCYKTLTFCSLLTRFTIPCACHAKAHLNVQKWSEPLVFLICWLLTWKCASRHNGVHFFDIATSKSGRNMVCCFTFWLGNVLRATTARTFSTSQRPTVFRTWGVFSFFTCKRASRHNGVHFFDISTSKRAPTLRCFAHFDLQMCFAPQRRALFRHHNFQKWSDVVVLCTFWLGNVLRATTACNFSSLIWPAGSAPAALASLLFDPLEPQIIGKTQCFATFLPFRAPGSSFFWLFLFSDLLSSALLSSALLFSILLLHLCFSSVHTVGSLTSKFPSIISI